MPNDIVDKYSIEKTVDELQEIEDGLVKLMAYRVYSSCVKYYLRVCGS